MSAPGASKALALAELARVTSLVTDEERLAAIARDESDVEDAPSADCAAYPESAEETARVVETADRCRVPVTARGGGTGMTGGAVAVRGGVHLVTTRMNRIVDVDAASLLAVVEPGVVLADLHRAVEAERLFYPPDPASLDSCTIGGNVAENAGGPRALRYGVTSEYVLGLQVATPVGLLELGGRTRKGVVGLNLAGLMVGSEGTLGVVTRAYLRLLPLPPAVSTALVPFADADVAARAVSDVIVGGLLPRTLEFLDAEAAALVADAMPFSLPDGVGALLILEVDGSESACEEAVERAGERLLNAGALDVLLAKGETDAAKVWEARRNLSSALDEAFAWALDDDVCVLRADIAKAARAIKGATEGAGLGAVVFGHAGDGNLHFKLVAGETPDGATVTRVRREIYAYVLSLGGTIAAEHGVGLTKRAFVAMEQSPEVIAAQRALKRALDPNGTMNPGKLWEE